jgi:leader peptidase (prepilin peptidase)/N-methyltransferase
MYAVSALALVELLLPSQVDLALPVFLALFFVRFAFVWGLLTASFIDLQKLLLPDFITLGGTVLGFAASLMLPGIGWRASLLGIALGAGIPYAFYFVWDRFLKRDGMGLGDVKLLAMVGALLGPHAVLFALFLGSMQGILATLLARVTGWKLAPDIDPDDLDYDVESFSEKFLAFVSRVTGWKLGPSDDEEDHVGETDLAATGEGPEPLMRTMIPFGPFLALGAIEYMLGGDRLMQTYLSLLRGQ